MDTQNTSVEPQPPPDNEPAPQGENPRFRLILAGALGIALIFILVILAIQIMEFMSYRAPQSVWPSANGAAPAPTPPVQAIPSSVTPIAVTSAAATVSKPLESSAANMTTVSAASK